MSWLAADEAQVIRAYAHAVHGRPPVDDPGLRAECLLVLDDFLRRFLADHVRRGRPTTDLSAAMPAEVAWLREHLSSAPRGGAMKVLARIVLSRPATLTVRGSR